MIRAQVFSFTRLAWKILQETGGISRYHLNSTGISMLIQKIIEDKKEELSLYRRTADKAGFINQMEQMLIEFKRYCIQPQELTEMTNDQQDEKVLKDKLHDLQLIYENFEAELSNKYIDSEDYFRLLSEKISKSAFLENAEIYIDGFHSFTPQEYMIIDELMKHCPQVSITLTVDKPFYTQEPDDLHLFRLTGGNFRTLFEMAKVNGLTVEELVLNEQKRWISPALQHLEAHFDSRPVRPYTGETPIYMAEAVNRRAEIEGVARNIRRLVREEDLSLSRYRDSHEEWSGLSRNDRNHFW